MCHEWCQRRMQDGREASRDLWEEFEQTRPVNEPEVTGEEAEVTLETPHVKPLAVER